MAAPTSPKTPAARASSLQHPRVEKRADAGSRAVRIPPTRIDDVSFDRQNRDTCVLERTLDEEAPGCRRLHAARTQDEGAVDPMLACLLRDPLGGPRRVVQVLVEACRATGQRRHRVVEAVADIAIGPECEIHRPDEDRPMRRLEGGVERGVVPEAGADPHQSRALTW